MRKPKHKIVVFRGPTTANGIEAEMGGKPTVTIVFYGPKGAGKTVLAGVCYHALGAYLSSKLCKFRDPAKVAILDEMENDGSGRDKKWIEKIMEMCHA